MKTCTSVKNVCKLFSLIFSMITFLYVVYIVVVEKTYLPGGSFMSPLLRSKELKTLCSSNWTGDTIVHLKNSRTYVISAYLDLRSRSLIRVIGITYRYEQEPLFCDFCFHGTNETVPAEIEIHSDHFQFPYGTMDLLCNLKDSRIPQYIHLHAANYPSNIVFKVHNIEQTHNPPSRFEYDFLLCISALFGSYNNVLQFIQSMEMYRMLGVQKVILYHTDSSAILKQLLTYYIKQNFLELIPWPITTYINVSSGWHYPEHPGDLHYYGQTAALNDCIYRNMYRSKYIALNDIDELILPARHKNWNELVDYLQHSNPDASVFIFENHVFPISFVNQSKPDPEEWKSVPGVNIIRHDHREPNDPSEVNPTKLILNPRDVVRTSVHTPLDFSGQEYRVPREIAQLCHYRQPKKKEITDDMLIEDYILSPFENALVERVNRVIGQLELLKLEQTETLLPVAV
ncbi:uncharacterized protein LOC134573263 [Pelobates fuscus]|uniref:uncharacterized protein LOC134573263 n=1 Tax=Pelobates fuscus TaxID=191477 RepID=UPI002FE4713B